MGKRQKDKVGGGEIVIAIIALFLLANFWKPILVVAAVSGVVFLIYVVIRTLTAGKISPIAEAPPLQITRTHTSIAPRTPPPLVTAYMEPAPPPAEVRVPVPVPAVAPSKSDTIRCDRCRTWLPMAARFCRKCGLPQPIAHQAHLSESPAGRVAV